MNSNQNTDSRKIAIVVTAKLTAASFVSGFARYMAEQGHQIFIIADSLDASFEKIGSGSVTLMPVPMHRDPSPLHDLKSLYYLMRTLNRIRPQFLLYGTPKASLLSSLAGFALQIPTRVYQLWGLRMETVSGLKRGILWFMELLTSILSTKVLANSQSLSTKYKSLGLSKNRQIDVLGAGSSHGVDLQYFSNKHEYLPVLENISGGSGRKSSKFIIGFVGRLHPDKGIDTLLDAVRILQNKNVELTLLLVGSDEGANLDFSDGIDECILTIGRVEDTRPYYAVMDVLILPSLREGFPNVVLEAAAMSVPAVVSDGTGVVDSVRDGETGLIVPVGDSVALAEAIQSLYDNLEFRKRMSSAARLWVEGTFDQNLVWARTLAYVLGENPSDA